MTTEDRDQKPDLEIPYFQKLYDRPILWLVLGMAIMILFYTGWGIVEIVNMTKAPLP